MVAETGFDSSENKTAVALIRIILFHDVLIERVQLIFEDSFIVFVDIFIQVVNGFDYFVFLRTAQVAFVTQNDFVVSICVNWLVVW